jgi:hypothetical protein
MERDVIEAVLGRYKEDRGGGKKLRPASERVPGKNPAEKNPKKVDTKPTMITYLKRRGPRKGEATASQVQGWRGSDRTNTNRKGHEAHARSYRDVKEAQDHEVSMAQSQLKGAKENISKLQKKLGKKEKNIPAWMQAKITDTAHNMDAASSYEEAYTGYYGSKEEQEDKKQETANKERNLRMKHGKRWREFTRDAVAAKERQRNRLRPGEVKTFNKTTGKWESNKD